MASLKTSLEIALASTLTSIILSIPWAGLLNFGIQKLDILAIYASIFLIALTNLTLFAYFIMEAVEEERSKEL